MVNSDQVWLVSEEVSTRFYIVALDALIAYQASD
jgi:hypothetical protein